MVNTVDKRLQMGQRLFQASVEGQLGQCFVVQVKAAGFSRYRLSAQRYPGKLVQPLVQLLGRHQYPGWGQDGAQGIDPTIFVTRLHIGVKMVQRRLHGVIDQNAGALWQVVKQRCGLTEEQRQVVLNPRADKTAADVLKQGAVAVIDVELFTEAVFELLNAALVHGKLVAGQQLDFGDGGD